MTDARRESARIGWIGAGERLRAVMREMVAAAPPGGVRFDAVFDPDPASVEATRAEFGAEIALCGTAEELLARPGLDWAMIGSPNAHHAAHAVAALEAGLDVFCEKPLATNLEDCLAIRDAVARTGKTFALGLVLRYSPHYRKIAEIVRSGALGKIISFEFNETLEFNHGGYIHGNWRRHTREAGSHMLEKCCHDLDVANWLIGSLPVRAASFGGRDFFKPENAGLAGPIGLSEEGRPAYRTWVNPRGVDPFTSDGDIVDNQVAILEYAGGERATFHTNCNAGIPERRLYACGSEGALRADMNELRIETRRIGFGIAAEELRGTASGAHGGGDAALGRGLVASMLEGAAPLASVEEGLRSAIVAFAIDRALAEGCVVDLRPLWERAGIRP